MYSKQKLLDIAFAEVGYLEKKSNKDLDSKTGNAGNKNYTKYNRDYNAWGAGGTIDMQWCAAFVSWCFVKAYGLEAAKTLLCGGLHHYTPTGANRFKKANRYIKRGQGTPEIGDVVYFYSKAKGRIGHVGIVYNVDSTTVYTVEGNTSGASALITNGGGVCKKSYKLTSTYIDGYGRPNYGDSAIPTTPTTPTITNYAPTVLEWQKAAIADGFKFPKYGADGKWGDECISVARVALVKRQVNYTNKNLTKIVQKVVGVTVDGLCGVKTEQAIKEYQKANDLRADGVVGLNTWRKMLNK